MERLVEDVIEMLTKEQPKKYSFNASLYLDE